MRELRSPGASAETKMMMVLGRRGVVLRQTLTVLRQMSVVLRQICMALRQVSVVFLDYVETF